MKKVLCVILCSVLLLGLYPAAFAAENSEFDIQNGVLLHYKGNGGTVTIPAGVTEISGGAFSGVIGKSFITSVIIPEGCVKIGEEAFYFVGDLSPSVTVTLPSTLREIGNRAFECARITKISFPNGLERIGDEAFSQTLLESVSLPASLKSLGADAFNGCESLTQVSWPGHTFTQAELQMYFFGSPFYYAGASNESSKPNPGAGAAPGAAASDFTIENGVLTHCGAYQAVAITVPEGVTKIAEGAFSSCPLMQEVVLPSTLQTIGTRAFTGSNLRRISIPDSVVSIEGYAFSGCRYLSQADLPAGLTRLDEHTFQNCASLTQIRLPAGLKYIGEYAFAECRQLETVNLPSSLIEIGEYAFRSTAIGGALNLPAGLKVMGSGAFSSTDITSITFPEGMDYIGGLNFCESLTSITFPKTGKAVEGTDDSFTSSFGGYFSSPNLKEVHNIPSSDYAEYLASNQAIFDALGDPQGYLYSQSPAVTAKAHEITVGLAGDYEKARAIHEWVAKNIEYDYAYFRGEKDTSYSDPDDVLANRLAVCDGFSSLTLALLQAVDIPAVCITGTAHGYHAWNAAYVDDRWILMDSTWSRPGGSGDIYNYQYFDPNIFFFSISHKAFAVQGYTFLDVPDWCAAAANWAGLQNIASGYGQHVFGPNDPCTHAQILTFLWRVEAKPAAKAPSPFTVAEYYQDAVDWAYEKGLIDSGFDPDAPCTRASAIKYIWLQRVLNASQFESDSLHAAGSGFTDVPADADYAQAVTWAVNNGIAGGYPGNIFAPNEVCSRGHIITFLHRTYVSNARLPV